MGRSFRAIWSAGTMWARFPSTRSVRRAGNRAGRPSRSRPTARPRQGGSPDDWARGGSPVAIDLRTRLGHVELPNPILTASGCAGSGRDLAHYFDVAKIGAVVTKSVMLDPRAGRPTPRMAETPSGMLNSIGLQGPGIDAFVDDDLPWLVDHGARAIVSIAGSSADEYAKLAQRLRGRRGVAMIEV